MSIEEANSINSTPSVVEQEESEFSSLFLTLPTKQQRFVHLYITGQYSLAKLAQLLEVHPNTLSNWLKREDVRSVIAELQENTHEIVANQLKSMSLVATNKLRELINSPLDAVALQATKDVLDRVGHKPKNEIKIDKTVTTVEQKLQSLIEKTIVDVDYEVVEDDGE